jgi:hypothetical protein
MLKHTSVGSSTPQVRSGSGMRPYKTDMTPYNSLLESMIFPTYNIVKEVSQRLIETNYFHVWKRPAHLRAHWLILSSSPAILVDIRNNDNVYSLKFPYDTHNVQKLGPIVCEVAYDKQEDTLWIWDLVIFERKNLWSTLPYSKRWEILQKMVRPLIYDSHPMCEIRICYPEWKPMKNFVLESEEVGYSYEFQPEGVGQKRLLWLVPKKQDSFKAANFHEREMISHTTCAIIPDETPTPIYKPVNNVDTRVTTNTKFTVGYIIRDKLSKLPDTYKLSSISGQDLGLPAIRSMEMSTKLRNISSEGCKVEIKWYDSFQKYEICSIINK